MSSKTGVRRRLRHANKNYRISFVVNVLLGILFVLLAVVVIVYWGFAQKDKVEVEVGNPLSNDVITASEIVEMPNLSLVYDNEVQSYNSINTYQFKIVNDEGNECILNSGTIELTDIITTVNEFLSTIENRVCSIGIVGSRLFIQVDTRDSYDAPYKVNIMTLQDNLKSDDWIELCEVIHDKCIVHADNLISYKTTLGNTHYMYIYSERSKNTGSIIDSEAITAPPETVPEIE